MRHRRSSPPEPTLTDSRAALSGLDELLQAGLPFAQIAQRCGLTVSRLRKLVAVRPARMRAEDAERLRAAAREMVR